MYLLKIVGFLYDCLRFFTVIGDIDLGGLANNYLFFFANGSQDANWQGATKGFAGNVLVNGILASERASGGVPFAGTIPRWEPGRTL